MKLYQKISVWVGSIIVAFLLIPEIMTVIKNKSAKDLSYLFLSLHIIMGILFIVFSTGIQNDSGLLAALPGYISNSVSIIFASVLIYLKNKYEKEK
jgi:uncharacterized protein with PQ loop repeat